MRGVNIHADFVMIQCTKNKILTSLSHPLCTPPFGGVRISFMPDPGLRPSGCTPGYHMPPRHAARLQNSARLRLPSSPCGLRRGMHHLPDKFQFIELFMDRKARTSLFTAGGTNHFSAAGIGELLSKFQGGIAGSIFGVHVDTGNS